MIHFCITKTQGTEVQVSSSFFLIVPSKSNKVATCLHALLALKKQKQSVRVPVLVSKRE